MLHSFCVLPVISAAQHRIKEVHVPVQLVKSLSREDAEELHIPSNALKRFRYLNRSGCTSIAGTDDVADFHLVQHAMDAVNIDKKAQVRSRAEPLDRTCHPEGPEPLRKCPGRERHSLVICCVMPKIGNHAGW